MFVVSSTNQAGLTWDVDHETSPFLAVKVLFRVHSKKYSLQ